MDLCPGAFLHHSDPLLRHLQHWGLKHHLGVGQEKIDDMKKTVPWSSFSPGWCYQAAPPFQLMDNGQFSLMNDFQNQMTKSRV